MHPRAKSWMVSVLVAAFAVQTWLVYADEPGEPLDRLALEGRRIWHREACQVCHQLWGQGGFLGPDLTNVGRSLDSTRLTSLLSAGSGQMPAFHLSTGDIAAVRAYLIALDRPERGRGQLRLGKQEGTPWERFEHIAAPLLDAESSGSARRGWSVFASRPCGSCHQPLAPGLGGAIDLSTTAARMPEDSLRAVLRDGRPQRGMPAPAPAFSADERENVLAFVRWLGASRNVLRAGMDSARGKANWRWQDLPWWEYR